MRLGAPSIKTLSLFIEQPRKRFSGAEISKLTGIGSGTLYPLLSRLEDAGWLASTWEEIDPRDAKRPRRRFYEITGHGYGSAFKALREMLPVGGSLQWKL